MSKEDGKCDCAAHSAAECVCGVWAETKCDTCEYRANAHRHREQYGVTIRLREELCKALHLSDDVWGDQALEQALAEIGRMKARAARWKRAAKAIRKRQADEQAFEDACATEEYLNEGPT